MNILETLRDINGLVLLGSFEDEVLENIKLWCNSISSNVENIQKEKKNMSVCKKF